MALSVSRNDGRVTLTLSDDAGNSRTVRCPEGVYDVLVNVSSDGLRNKELQFALVEAVKCSAGRASSIIEKFTPGYQAFCGVALLEGFYPDGSRERMYRPAKDGVASSTSMLTHRKNGSAD